MNNYHYRDKRKQKLFEALAAAPSREVRAQLETEQSMLQQEGWALTDVSYEAIAAEWCWQHSDDLMGVIARDSVLRATGTPVALSAAQALAIQNSRTQQQTAPPPHYLEQVRDILGNDEHALTQLIHAAHSAWLGAEEQPYPFDDVGVLMPLRLETLFDAPGSAQNTSPAQWKLSLRVLPDEASICRDDAFVSPGESAALLAYWQTIRQPGPLQESWMDGASAEQAWSRLCDRVSPPRAAWLIGTVEVVLNQDALQLVLPGEPGKSQPNRVGGLPAELWVYAFTAEPVNGQTKLVLGRLPMKDDQQINAQNLLLSLPSEVESAQNSWWANWEMAKTVGLGGEWLLPPGVTPQTIEALYVTGIGDETPQTHFKAQIDAGKLSVISLGMPTNAVDGKGQRDGPEPADWQKVARYRLRQRLGTQLLPEAGTGNLLQQYLTGQKDALPFFPGADAPDQTSTSRLMLRALWPALWGHWIKEFWKFGEASYPAALWAFSYVCPEGPLMPVRIGDQPYGLLPVTTLDTWEASPQNQFLTPETETQLAHTLYQLSFELAAAARGKRSVVGQPASKFTDLLGQDARSHHFIYRHFLPYWAPMVLYPLTADQQKEFRKRALRTYDPAMKVFGREPDGVYLANSHAVPVRLPLVQPGHYLFRHRQGDLREPVPLETLLSLLLDFPGTEDLQNYELDVFFQRFWPLEANGEFQLSTLPDSLLMRLLVYACQEAFLWHRAAGDAELPQQLLVAQRQAAIGLANILNKPEWIQKQKDPVTGGLYFTNTIPPAVLQEVERTFCATLDCAAHRMDHWSTGFAWQRLQQHSESPQKAYRMGAYGWVDGPFTGSPGPTEAGRLHTPSYNQTLAALILRDKYLSASQDDMTNEAGARPWHLQITSSKVRWAKDMAEEVRMGFHIYEVLGRQVEQIIAHPQRVRDLRRNVKYAMYPERCDPNEVCNGYQALQGLLKGDVEFALDDSQQAALASLQDALDTYSDLLMADGILQLINHQVDRAAETMDAAAGFSRPPSFESIQTPPSGYHLESVVLSVLPFVPLQSLGGDAHPMRLADPSLAAFLESILGSDWTWQAVNLDNQASLGSITLHELGLGVLDTLAVSESFVAELARRKLNLPLVFITEERNRVWEARKADGTLLGTASLADLKLTPKQLAGLQESGLSALVGERLGVAENVLITEILPPADARLWIALDEKGQLLGMVAAAGLDALPKDPEKLLLEVRKEIGLPRVQVNTPRSFILVRQLIAALGSRPAAGRDVSGALTDASLYEELLDRYKALHQNAQQLLADLQGATDDQLRSKFLRQALPWGILPATEPGDQDLLISILLGQSLPEGVLGPLVEKALSSLQNRLAQAVKPEEVMTKEQLGKPLDKLEEKRRKEQPEGVASLARAIANLASPQARLAILACWQKDSLIQNTGLVTAEPEPLDEEWLTVVAATRSGLARLEALQLELQPPLTSWSNKQGDPWQRGEGQAVQNNLEKRKARSPLSLEMPRLVTAFGPPDAWGADKVAVGLMDAFSEAIPMPHRKTVTAFGFNAPASRAPQSILLAVPPRLKQRLEADVLVEILRQVRAMAQGRMARLEDLGSLQSLFPAMWLPASGPAHVRLEPWPLFEIL